MVAVETLGPEAYQGYLEPVGEGNDARTHKALVRFNNEAYGSDCYVKAYCASLAPKGLVNELIGYALAKHGGFDVPRRAAVLLLDSDQALAFGSGFNAPTTVSGHVLAWCVESLDRPTPKTVFQLSPQDVSGLPSLQADLQKWRDLPSAVSFDSWLSNDDRNPGNLVRLSAGRYALIDHGRVCSGNAWQSPLDKAEMGRINLLALWAWSAGAMQFVPRDQQLPLITSFDRHGEALEKAASDIDYWLGELVDPVEKADAEAFLDERVSTVREHLSQTFGMLAV